MLTTTIHFIDGANFGSCLLSPLAVVMRDGMMTVFEVETLFPSRVRKSAPEAVPEVIHNIWRMPSVTVWELTDVEFDKLQRNVLSNLLRARKVKS